ncbi:hypothetical protein [Caballeronia sp. HLA56]
MVARIASLLIAVTLMQVMGGCATHDAYRTNVGYAEASRTDCRADTEGYVSKDCEHVTPEISKDKYELHFVEFDDQGWSFADKTATANEHPSPQIDQLMLRLRTLLSGGQKVKIILFVHGWKHNAWVRDDNVRDFRRLLERAAADELYHEGKNDPRRMVVGIYVGWRGNPSSFDNDNPLLNATFWTRKDAASRVASGSVRELFARLRSMRRYYNIMALQNNDPVPPVRSLMIGHSFGGLILYTATSGPLIESLTSKTDLAGLRQPKLNFTLGDDENQSFESVDRVADMIVLVNPAFEASRFQTLYTVAQRRTSAGRYEAPVLVSITSATDDATRLAFPAGRFFNTLFERPTSSDQQASAIKQTPGNMADYVTHELKKPVDGTFTEPCHGWTKTQDLLTMKNGELDKVVSMNKSLENEQADKQIESVARSQRKHERWTRTFCGGATLEVAEGTGTGNIDTVVWNIKAESTIIDGHGNVMNPALLEVVRQIFSDTDDSRKALRRAVSMNPERGAGTARSQAQAD